MKRRIFQALLAILLLVSSAIEAATLSEAIEKARRDTGGGKVLSARTEVRGEREVHVIKVLTPGGRVKTIRIDGNRRRPS